MLKLMRLYQGLHSPGHVEAREPFFFETALHGGDEGADVGSGAARPHGQGGV